VDRKKITVFRSGGPGETISLSCHSSAANPAGTDTGALELNRVGLAADPRFLLVLVACLATLGDRFGRPVGKARLSLFICAPRKTARTDHGCSPAA